jgi:CubicO group peptidase (beta-lactamase class C family)
MFQHRITNILNDVAERYRIDGADLAVFRGDNALAYHSVGSRNAGALWDQSTRCCVYSVSKAILALRVALAVQDGMLSYGATFAELSPWFTNTNLSNIRLSDVLSHKAGLVAFSSEICDQHIYDNELMINAVLEQRPSTLKGQLAYSPFLFGWILQALLRQTSIASQFVHSPDASCYVQPGENDYAKLVSAPNIVDIPTEMSLAHYMRTREGHWARSAFTNPTTLMVGHNSSDWRRALIPAANIHTNAYYLAQYVNQCVNRLNSLDELVSVASMGHCPVTNAEHRFSMGMMLADEKDRLLGLPGTGFGHIGAGGSFVWHDVKLDVTVAFVTRSLSRSLFMDRRGLDITNEILSIVERSS